MSVNASAMRVGRTIRALRGELSQERVAKSVSALGFSTFTQVTLSRIEAGKREPTLGEALALAEVLGVSLEALNGGATQAEIQATAAARELEQARAALHAAQFRYEQALEKSDNPKNQLPPGAFWVAR